MPSKTYRALTKEYTPIKISTLKLSRTLEKKAAKKAAQAQKKPNVVAGIATLNAAHTQATSRQPTTIKQVIEALNVKEAHELYRELKTLFGG
jgi:hypothetical protein